MLLLWQHQQAIEHQLTGQRQPKEGKREMLSTAVVGEISVCVWKRESVYHAHVSVDVEDAFVGSLLIQFGQHQLLHAKHHSVLAADGHCRAVCTHIHTQLRLAAESLGCDSSCDPLATYLLFSTAFMAYSTWKTRPSGEKVEADRSYCGKHKHTHIIIIRSNTLTCTHFMWSLHCRHDTWNCLSRFISGFPGEPSCTWVSSRGATIQYPLVSSSITHSWNWNYFSLKRCRGGSHKSFKLKQEDR